MTAAIAIILVIGGLIFFHELGHFLVARACGVGVSKFSLGLGPRLFGITRNKTHYQVAAIPLGGFVMLVGEQEGESLPENFTPEESFSNHPTWQKLLIVAAGPVFNILIAWVLAWGLLWHNGETLIVPEVGTVQEGSPAAAAGLAPGDLILRIDGQEISSWEKITPIVYNAKDRPLEVDVRRKTAFGTEDLTFTVTPVQHEVPNVLGRSFKNWIIGIAPAQELTLVEHRYGFFESALLGVGKVWGYVEAIGQFLKDAVTLQVEADSLVGPIGMGQLIGMSAERGLSSVLELTLFISINLAVLNLLPIPVLDGGHIMFFVIEMAIGRKLPDKFKEVALRVGLLLLLSLMGLAVFNDVVGLLNS
ncbi:MAG: RIP metalloprotease RseP [Desulfovibrionaceae bacterium]|nr:RIP metalloprotease RseP [Desulfovibrionaceae bacterium]